MTWIHRFEVGECQQPTQYENIETQNTEYILLPMNNK